MWSSHSEMSVIKQVSAVEGCPLSGVRLYTLFLIQDDTSVENLKRQIEKLKIEKTAVETENIQLKSQLKQLQAENSLLRKGQESQISRPPLKQRNFQDKPEVIYYYITFRVLNITVSRSYTRIGSSKTWYHESTNERELLK